MSRRLLSLLAPAGLALLFALAAPSAQAQEFNCNVSVDFQALTGNDYTYLRDLEQLVEEYMNMRPWTEDRYEDFERIECTMQVIFEEALSLTSFRTRLVVASRRPIYGTTQSSTVAQFNDGEWQFNYVQGAPLIRDLERYDPITSVLDFYAYVMLGYDYDTFSERGGSRHFDRARRIAEIAQGQGAPGWRSMGNDQSRMALITQLTDPRFQPLRDVYFTYHFHGLDHFVSETDLARQSVLAALQQIEAWTDDVSRQFALDVFFNTKYQELAAVFQDSPLRGDAYDLLSQIDPAHLTEYNRLVQ